MTIEGDLVLVYMDERPAFFARIEGIDPDVKPQWFRVRMLLLQIPLVTVTWILRQPQIDGEQFTMSGRPVRLEKVVAPPDSVTPAAGDLEEIEDIERPDVPASPEAAKAPEPPAVSVVEEKPEPEPEEKGAKVISLAERRKRNQPS